MHYPTFKHKILSMEEIIIILIFVAIITALVIVLLFTRKPSAWKNTALIKLAELESHINSGNSAQMKHAVAESDKILGFALKSKGIKGETLGERLKNASKYFDKKTYQEVWDGHKMRNRLAHEMDFNPKSEDLKKAYKQIKKGVSSL